MTTPNAWLQPAFTLAQDLNTRGLQGWIQDNVIPLVLLGIAIILLWIGGRGDNAGVARRSVGLIVGLIALGIAVSGNGPEIEPNGRPGVLRSRVQAVIKFHGGRANIGCHATRAASDRDQRIGFLRTRGQNASRPVVLE